MNFTVSCGELSKALQGVSGVIGGVGSIPILECFLFDIQGNRLVITAADTNTTLVTSLEVQAQQEGKVAIPAKRFLEIIKNFGNQPVTFRMKETDQGQGKVLEVQENQNYFAIPLEDAEQYPTPLDFSVEQSVQISHDVLARAIGNTLYCTSSDEMRPVMTGVFFEFRKDCANFVATDGGRLAVYTRTDIQTETPMGFVIPKRTLSLVKSLLDNENQLVTISFNKVNAQLDFGGKTCICRLIDHEYPKYEAAIPHNHPNTLIIERELFLNSLKKALPFSNNMHVVKFHFSPNGYLRLNAEDKDLYKKAEVTVPCDYQGEELSISFNGKYIADMLNTINVSSVKMKLAQARATVMVPTDTLGEGESVLMLTMPLQEED